MQGSSQPENRNRKNTHNVYTRGFHPTVVTTCTSNGKNRQAQVRGTFKQHILLVLVRRLNTNSLIASILNVQGVDPKLKLSQYILVLNLLESRVVECVVEVSDHNHKKAYCACVYVSRFSMVCARAVIRPGAVLNPGSITSYGVVIGAKHSVQSYSHLSLCKQREAMVSQFEPGFLFVEIVGKIHPI